MGGFNVLKSQALKIIQVRISSVVLLPDQNFDSESSKTAKRGVRVMQKIAIGKLKKDPQRDLKV